MAHPNSAQIASRPVKLPQATPIGAGPRQEAALQAEARQDSLGPPPDLSRGPAPPTRKWVKGQRRGHCDLGSGATRRRTHRYTHGHSDHGRPGEAHQPAEEPAGRRLWRHVPRVRWASAGHRQGPTADAAREFAWTASHVFWDL